MLLLPILYIVFSTLFLPSVFFSHLSLSPALTHVSLPRVSRWKWLMLPLPKCQTMAAPTKGFVALPLEEAQKEWRFCVPQVPHYMPSIFPNSTRGQEKGQCWALEEARGFQGPKWAHHLGSETGKDTTVGVPVSWWLGLGGDRREICHPKEPHPDTPWRRRPLPKPFLEGKNRLYFYHPSPSFCGHRTGRGQFWSQFQWRTVLKNVQTTW